jgi:WD40 repeat protein
MMKTKAILLTLGIFALLAFVITTFVREAQDLPIINLPYKRIGISCVCLAGDVLITGGYEGKVSILRPPKFSRIEELPMHEDRVADVWSLGEERIASVSYDQRLVIFNLKRKEKEFEFNPDFSLRCSSFCKKANLIVSGSANGEIIVIPIQGTVGRNRSGPNEPTDCIALNHEGSLCVASWISGKIGIFKPPFSSSEPKVIRHSTRLTTMTVID